MWRVIKSELKRAFTSWGFVFSMLIEILIISVYIVFELAPIVNDMIPQYRELAKEGMVNYIPGAFYSWLGMLNSTTHKLLKAIIPIMIAIPYGDSLYVDNITCYIDNVCVRLKKGKFYFVKIIVMFISGGFVAVFPYLTSFLIVMAVLPLETVCASNFNSIGNIALLSDIYYSNTFLYVILYLILTFVGFGILNCLCFVATYIMNNRFMVMLFPFIVDYSMEVIASFFVGRRHTPWIYLNICNFWKTDVDAAIIQFSIFIILIVITLVIKGNKRTDVL